MKNKHFEQHQENQAISITSFEQPEATFEQDKGNFEQYPEKSSNIKKNWAILTKFRATEKIYAT